MSQEGKKSDLGAAAKKPSASAVMSNRVSDMTSVEKTTRFSALPGKGTTLSTNLSKLKREQRLQAKKSLCSKDILNLLNDDDSGEALSNTDFFSVGRNGKIV